MEALLAETMPCPKGAPGCWGQGFLRLFPPSGIFVSLELGQIRLTRPLRDDSGIVDCRSWPIQKCVDKDGKPTKDCAPQPLGPIEEPNNSSVHLEGIAGDVSAAPGVPLVGMHNWRTNASIRNVRLTGLTSLVSKPQVTKWVAVDGVWSEDKVPFWPGEESGVGGTVCSDDHAECGGTGWLETAMEYKQNAGLRLGPRRVDVYQKGGGPSNPGRVRHGDMVLYRAPKANGSLGHVYVHPESSSGAGNNGYLKVKASEYKGFKAYGYSKPGHVTVCDELGICVWKPIQVPVFVDARVAFPHELDVCDVSAGDNVEFLVSFPQEFGKPPATTWHRRVVVAVDVVRRELMLDQPLPPGGSCTLRFVEAKKQLLPMGDVYDTEA